MDQAVAIMGNLTEGFEVVGPFEDFDEAAAFAVNFDSWITSLVSPEEWLRKEKQYQDNIKVLKKINSEQ